MPSPVLRTLLTDLIDYAGLFPPAKLPMQGAVEAYNRARLGAHEWMFGRFICPLDRLDEFSACAAAILPGTFGTSGYREHANAGEPWRLSVILEPPGDGSLDPLLDRIDAFNQRHSGADAGLAEIDMCEMKVASPAQVDTILDQMPEGLFPFFEFPVTEDCRGLIASLSGSVAGAKIRTGGIVGNAFPTPAEVSAFLHACHHADVVFKATAGLHHPVRGNYRLTYEKDSPSCVMHGFLNLFIAAALVRVKGIDHATTVKILASDDGGDLRMSEQMLGWREFLLDGAGVARARESFALSFGSCSFDEPIDDLVKLTWLSPSG